MRSGKDFGLFLVEVEAEYRRLLQSQDEADAERRNAVRLILKNLATTAALVYAYYGLEGENRKIENLPIGQPIGPNLEAAVGGVETLWQHYVAQRPKTVRDLTKLEDRLIELAARDVKLFHTGEIMALRPVLDDLHELIYDQLGFDGDERRQFMIPLHYEIVGEIRWKYNELEKRLSELETTLEEESHEPSD